MKKIRLGDYCTVSAGGDKPKVFSDIKTSECSVPVFANGIDNEGLVGFTNRASIESNSVTLSARGNTGTPFYRTKPYVPIIRLISVIPDKEYINCQYLYYLLKTRNISGTGSVQSQLTVPMVENITVPIIEDLKEQLKIATYLGNIDKKISNNNDISSQLESLAKTIYDYWFLQFEFPDENGRPYKSSGGKMVWNEELKREIPEGWEVDRLEKVCDTLLGGTPDTENALYWNGDIPWLNSGEVATSPVLNAEKTITKEGLKNSATSFASAGAVVMSITRYIRPSILGIDACFNQSVIAVIPNEQIHSTYLYLFMLSQVERYMRLRTGAQQPHINKETVDSTLITLPVDSVLNQFYDRVEPLFERQMIAMKEAKELEGLRDFLLPLLMNGQVTFEDNI